MLVLGRCDVIILNHRLKSKYLLWFLKIMMDRLFFALFPFASFSFGLFSDVPCTIRWRIALWLGSRSKLMTHDAVQYKTHLKHNLTHMVSVGKGILGCEDSNNCIMTRIITDFEPVCRVRSRKAQSVYPSFYLYKAKFFVRNFLDQK